jgi:hypothetical protein
MSSLCAGKPKWLSHHNYYSDFSGPKEFVLLMVQFFGPFFIGRKVLFLENGAGWPWAIIADCILIKEMGTNGKVKTENC